MDRACNEWMEEMSSRKKQFRMTRRVMEPAFSTQLEETSEDNLGHSMGGGRVVVGDALGSEVWWWYKAIYALGPRSGVTL